MLSNAAKPTKAKGHKMLNLTNAQIATINKAKQAYAEMVADGECECELMDNVRLEGTPLEIIACGLMLLEMESADT